MVLSRKYIVVLLAFAVGVIGAIGFSVHAQSVGSTTPSNPVQVPLNSTHVSDVSDGDGEQADDQQDAQKDTDVETNDDGKVQAVQADTHETEGVSDKGEVEDSQ